MYISKRNKERNELNQLNYQHPLDLKNLHDVKLINVKQLKQQLQMEAQNEVHKNGLM